MLYETLYACVFLVCLCMLLYACYFCNKKHRSQLKIPTKKVRQQKCNEKSATKQCDKKYDQNSVQRKNAHPKKSNEKSATTKVFPTTKVVAKFGTTRYCYQRFFLKTLKTYRSIQKHTRLFSSLLAKRDTRFGTIFMCRVHPLLFFLLSLLARQHKPSLLIEYRLGGDRETIFIGLACM